MIFVLMRYLFLFLCLFSELTVKAQKSPFVVHRDSIRNITKEALLQDLDAYADGIKSNHINPFTHIRRKDFLERVQRIKDSSASLDADQLLVELMKVNAAIRDEHTNIMYVGRDVFPIESYCFEDGVYVTHIVKGRIDLLYSRVLAVNNIPIGDVIARISTILPDSNAAAVKKSLSRYLFDPFVLHGLRISPARADISFKLVTFRNDTVNVTPPYHDRRGIREIQGFDKTVFLRTSRKQKNWFTYIDSSRALYFKYATCFDDKDCIVADLLKAIKDTIEARQPERLVIDMRDNGGGRSSLLNGFINYLSLSGLGRGKVYVLIGRKTFSAAILNSVALQKRANAVLVGEETSGSVAHFGSIKTFKLPATGLLVSYSTKFHQTDEDYEGSLKPDVLIPERFTDLQPGY